MKFTTYTTAFFVTLLSSLVIEAAPLNERDIFDPPILDPHTGTVWTIGQQATVVWDTSNPPKLITDRFNSLITLRKGGIESPMILASGFDILDGNKTITVPNVKPDDDYSIVLFGDSGNWSQDFTIKPE